MTGLVCQMLVDNQLFVLCIRHRADNHLLAPLPDPWALPTVTRRKLYFATVSQPPLIILAVLMFPCNRASLSGTSLCIELLLFYF